MIVLNTATDVVRVITASANAVDCHVTYVDNVTATPYLAARQNTAISSAGTTTILGSPAASTQRQVKKLSIVAKGGGNTVTIQLFDGSTAFLLFGNGIPISVGETIEYEDVTGWRVLDANGQLKQAFAPPIPTLTLLGNNTGGTANATALTMGQVSAMPGLLGRLLGVTTLQSGTTLTWNTLTRSAIVEIVGGGGGGGGCSNPGVSVALTTGGSSGGYCRKYFGITGATATYAIGAGGTAGNASGSNGGSGGNTTFSNGAVSLTAFGGNGSVGDVSGGGTGATFNSTVGPGVGSGGDINADGFRSGYSFRSNGTTLAFGGFGAPSYFGAGGNEGNLSTGGTPTTPGAGGGGTLALPGAGRAGGAGAPGVLIVWEFS